MTFEEKQKMAHDALRDLGITPQTQQRGATPFPEALREGSVASLKERAEARDAYFDKLIAKRTDQTTPDEKGWLAKQLADFGRQGGFDK